MFGLRVIIADTDPVFRKYIKEKLLNAGFMVVGEVSDGRSLLQMVFNIQPDLVIMNAQLLGKDGIEAAKAIEEHRMSPVVLIAEHNLQDKINEVLQNWMISYVLKPVDETNLFPAIEICVATFRRICRLEQENRKLKQTLETRKVIEKAKGLLTEFKGMTEQQAFRHIQKISMDKCLPVQKVASQIIKNLEMQKTGEGK